MCSVQLKDALHHALGREYEACYEYGMKVDCKTCSALNCRARLQIWWYVRRMEAVVQALRDTMSGEEYITPPVIEALAALDRPFELFGSHKEADQ